MKKIALKSLIIFLCSIVIGFLLLFLVYLLPTKSMKANVKETVYIIEEQGTSFLAIPQNEASRLDNYTDSLMLLHAIYDGNDSLVDKVISVYSKHSEHYISPVESLVDTVNEEELKAEE